MSISWGDVAGERHNVRTEYRARLSNVAPERTDKNIILHHEPLGDVYERLFGDAVREYDEKQKRADRRIGGTGEAYLRKVRSSVRQAKSKAVGKGRDPNKVNVTQPSYECVIQVGNRDTFSANDEVNRAIAARLYQQYFEEWKEMFPHFEPVIAAIHMDEATPHLHIEYVPWANYDRGQKARVSLSKAHEQMGMERTDQSREGMFQLLEEVAAEHGIERVDMGIQRAHLDVRTFKAIAADLDAGMLADRARDVPELVEAFQIATYDLEKAVKVIEELEIGLEEIAGKTGFLNKRALPQMARDLLDSTKKTRDYLRSTVVNLKPVWTQIIKALDYIIHPVTDAFRQAAWMRQRTVSEPLRSPEKPSEGISLTEALEGAKNASESLPEPSYTLEDVLGDAMR